MKPKLVVDSKHIKQVLKNSGVTGVQIAKELYLTPNTVWRKCNNQISFSLEDIIIIMCLTKKSFEELFPLDSLTWK